MKRELLFAHLFQREPNIVNLQMFSSQEKKKKKIKKMTTLISKWIM